MGIFSHDEDWCMCTTCANYKTVASLPADYDEHTCVDKTQDTASKASDCMAQMLAVLCISDRFTIDELDATCADCCDDLQIQKYIRDLVAKHIISYEK